MNLQLKNCNPNAMLGSMAIKERRIEAKVLSLVPNKQSMPPPEYRALASLIASNCGTSTAMMFSKTRKRECVEARQVFMYELKERTNKTLGKVGEISATEANPNGYDHATVLHSIKTVNNLRETDKAFNKRLNAIEEILNEDTSII